MPDPLQPLRPIIVDREFDIVSLNEDEGSKSFFCLDSAEFENNLLDKVAEIRGRIHRTVPIVVVVGRRARNHQQIHQEANDAAKAGAIYFEHPSGDCGIEELVGQICMELARFRDGFEPFQVEDREPEAMMAPGNNESAFYANPPFQLSERSLQSLLQRLNMDDSNPQKDD